MTTMITKPVFFEPKDWDDIPGLLNRLGDERRALVCFEGTYHITDADRVECEHQTDFMQKVHVVQSKEIELILHEASQISRQLYSADMVAANVGAILTYVEQQLGFALGRKKEYVKLLQDRVYEKRHWILLHLVHLATGTTPDWTPRIEDVPDRFEINVEHLRIGECLDDNVVNALPDWPALDPAFKRR